MTIGIVGAGSVGSAIGTVLARAGIEAKILNRRGPAAMGPLAALLAPHVTAGSREEVLGADIVFVAVPWTRLGEALGGADIHPRQNRKGHGRGGRSRKQLLEFEGAVELIREDNAGKKRRIGNTQQRKRLERARQCRRVDMVVRE